MTPATRTSASASNRSAKADAGQPNNGLQHPSVRSSCKTRRVLIRRPYDGLEEVLDSRRRLGGIEVELDKNEPVTLDGLVDALRSNARATPCFGEPLKGR